MPVIKPCELEKIIVPFNGSEHPNIQLSEALQVFQDLSKKTSTAIIYCDFAQFNSLNVCTTRDLICVENSRPVMQKSRAMSTLDQFMFPDILNCGRCMCSDVMTHGKCMCLDVIREQCTCSNVVTRDQRLFKFPEMIHSDLNNKVVTPYSEAIESDDEDVFEDCIDSPFKIFSLSASQSLCSKLYTTKKKLENLLSSLLFLHLLVGKKLQSWKDTTMSNISQLSTGFVSAIQTPTPHYQVAKPFVPLPEKSRGHPNAGRVPGKQLRRQNRFATKNNVVNSNRQRGMKNGRFQNNVGHRESWH
jgi:hypothetical protein